MKQLTAVTLTTIYETKCCNTNKSVFSFIRTLTTWHCPHSLAARRDAVRRAAIDLYFLPVGLQQQILLCGRQTDGHPVVS